MGSHVHRWQRCGAACSHPDLPEHWRCSGCRETTTFPPGDHHFLTPERIIGVPEPESMIDAELIAYVEVPEPDPEPDWIVIRPGPNLPHTMMPPGLDGTWVNRAREAGVKRPAVLDFADYEVARSAPTGRFETREILGQMQVAEVWELEPILPDPEG